MTVMRLTCKSGAVFYMISNHITEAVQALPQHNKDLVKIEDVSGDAPVIIAPALAAPQTVTANIPAGGDFTPLPAHDGAESIGSDDLQRLARERDKEGTPAVLGNIALTTPEAQISADEKQLDPIEEMERDAEQG